MKESADVTTSRRRAHVATALSLCTGVLALMYSVVLLLALGLTAGEVVGEEVPWIEFAPIVTFAVIGTALFGAALAVASAPRLARVVIMLCAAAGFVGTYLLSTMSEAGVELYLMWGAVAAVFVLAALLVPSRAR